jgi:TonB family protein
VLAVLAFVAVLATPEPSAVPSPACSRQNAAVEILSQAPAPYPDSARRLNIGPVVVLLNVTVDENGVVKNASILKSSNNMALDQTALRSAWRSTYLPKVVDCVPMLALYQLKVEIDP